MHVSVCVCVCVCVCVLSHFSCVQLFVTLLTVALYPWDFPGKNTGAGCHFLVQRLNPGLSHLLHWQAGCLSLVPPGKLSALDTKNENTSFIETNAYNIICVSFPGKQLISYVQVSYFLLEAIIILCIK